MKHTPNEIKEILQKAGLNVEVREEDGRVIVEENIKSRFRAKGKEGIRYYYVNDKGFIRFCDDVSDDIDEFRYNSGNYFQTEKEAESGREKLIIAQKMRDLYYEEKYNKGIDSAIDYISKEFTLKQILTVLL